MARPLFAGLRPTTTPKTTWSFYIALPLLSSNSAQEARMLLPSKMFVSVIVPSAGRQPAMPMANSRLLATACIPAKSVD